MKESERVQETLYKTMEKRKNQFGLEKALWGHWKPGSKAGRSSPGTGMSSINPKSKTQLDFSSGDAIFSGVYWEEIFSLVGEVKNCKENKREKGVEDWGK